MLVTGDDSRLFTLENTFFHQLFTHEALVASEGSRALQLETTFLAQGNHSPVATRASTCEEWGEETGTLPEGEGQHDFGGGGGGGHTQESAAAHPKGGGGREMK